MLKCNNCGKHLFGKNNPDTEFDWNIQYPVNVKFSDGETLLVNSTSEMETLKQDCD